MNIRALEDRKKHTVSSMICKGKCTKSNNLKYNHSVPHKRNYFCASNCNYKVNRIKGEHSGCTSLKQWKTG